MTESNTRVRRTQAEIVADLEAKAKAARDKLIAKERKAYDATYARYLKALDSVLESLAVAAKLADSVEEQATALDLEGVEHYLQFPNGSGGFFDLVAQAEQVSITDADGNVVEESTEDQG